MITYIFLGSRLYVRTSRSWKQTIFASPLKAQTAKTTWLIKTTWPTQRGYSGVRANKLLFDTPPSYGCKIERFLINIVYFKNYQPAIKKLGNNCLICLYTNNLSHSQSFTIPGTCSDGVAIFGGCAEQLQLRGILQSSKKLSNNLNSYN